MFLIVLGICQIVAGALAAQTTSQPESGQAVITASTSVASVQVAEPFSMEVKCVAPVGTNVSFPAVMEQLGEFDVIDHHDAFDVPLDSSTKQRCWTRQMTLESIVTGTLTVPAIEVQVSNQTETKRLASNPLEINVLSVLEDRPDPKNFRDVKPLVDVELESVTSYGWVGWTLGGLAGGSLLAWATIAFVRRRQFITPAQWAKREFDLLEQSAGSPREAGGLIDSEYFACQLSSIFREYLELQLEIAAPSQTTRELLAAVRTTAGFDDEIANRIGQLLALADRAKYAGIDLSETQQRGAIEEGRNLVNQIANQMTQVTAAQRDTSQQTAH
jgi:hypothetical protein